jgi:hypothetical protein
MALRDASRLPSLLKACQTPSFDPALRLVIGSRAVVETVSDTRAFAHDGDPDGRAAGRVEYAP